MEDLVVACSPITPTIFAGKLNKKGNQWVGKKQDVTEHCLSAVFEFIAVHKKTMIAEYNGKRYSIELEEVQNENNT
jgi:hypothetical protein